MTKKMMALFLVLCSLCGMVLCAPSAAAVSAQKKTMLPYTSLNLTFHKAEEDSYACTVANNKEGYIKVTAYNEGTDYWMMVYAKKTTPANRYPVITVYREENGTKTAVKKFQIVVGKFKKIAMSDVNINKGISKRIALENFYDPSYKLEYNKKIIKISNTYRDGKKLYPTITGLKNGKTTVKAYLSGTKTLAGSFSVRVGDFKAGVKKDCQNVTIYYNKHIDARYLKRGTLDVSRVINHFHANGVYSVKSSNAKLIGTISVAKGTLNPKAVKVFGKNTGKVTLTVYEKRGKAKATKIGTIRLTIKKAKDSEVYASYRALDNEGIFYDNVISPGESFDLKSAVVKRYLNKGKAAYHFAANEYTFTASSDRPDVISVDENGICHCHALDFADGGEAHQIRYKIVFKDDSVANGSGQFDIIEKDAEE